MQPGPEFVSAYCAMMLDGVTREMETTKKVIAAVPENKRDYRPDPHARTAWDLAWHIANSDVEFLDGIADMKFSMTETERTNKPATVAELRHLVRPRDEARHCPRPRHVSCSAGHASRFRGNVQNAGCVLSRLPQQPRHSPPRRARDLSAAYGIEGAVDLWRQLRRALPDASEKDRRSMSRVRSARTKGLPLKRNKDRSQIEVRPKPPFRGGFFIVRPRRFQPGIV